MSDPPHILSESIRVAKAATDAASACTPDAEGLLVLGVAAHLLLAKVIREATERKCTELYREALHKILALGPPELSRCLEHASRMLPQPLERDVLAENLMIQAALRSESLRDALIIISAICGKLAALLVSASGIDPEVLAYQIEDEVGQVQCALSDNVRAVGPQSGPPN